MAAAEPPGTVTIKWCPTCGQNDLHKRIGATVHKHPETGEWCYQDPGPLEYRIDVTGRLRVERHTAPDWGDEDAVVAMLDPHDWEWSTIGDNNLAVWNHAKALRKAGDERTEREIIDAVGPRIYERWKAEIAPKHEPCERCRRRLPASLGGTAA